MADMIDSKAPGAWKFEHWTVAQVRKLQQETRETMAEKAAQFENLGDIEAIYKLRCFCDGYFDGLKSDGLMGDVLPGLQQQIKAAEERAKRRVAKALGIRDPYRLPTLKEWSDFRLTTPQLKMPRMRSTSPSR